MHVRAIFLLTLGASTLLCVGSVSAEHVSLTSSPSAFQSARQIAKQNQLDSYVTSSDVRHAVERGELIEIGQSKHLVFSGSFPYTLPYVAEQLQKLSLRYHDFCGEKLRVTSLVRAKVRQPKNAAPNSLHRTGMAIDLGIPQAKKCREWLESALSLLEDNQLLFAWKADDPPHYHVAVNVSAPKLLLDQLPQELSKEEQVEAEEVQPSFVRAALSVPLGWLSASVDWLERYSVRIIGTLFLFACYRLVNPKTP